MIWIWFLVFMCGMLVDALIHKVWLIPYHVQKAETETRAKTITALARLKGIVPDPEDRWSGI